MRLNKQVEQKFKYRYDFVIEDIRASLVVIAAISVAFNTMSSPVLGLKALLIFIVSWYAARLTEIVFLMFSKELEYKEASMRVAESYPEVIGLIFALLIPIGTPLYVIVISLALGIIVSSIAFGGYSHNIFNVPVVAAVIAYISWPTSVTGILSESNWLDYLLNQAGALMQSPLDGILAMPDVITLSAPPNATVLYPTWSLFTNNPQVMLGLIPSIIIIVIGIRLIANEAIDYRIPLMISSLTIACSFLIAFFTHDSGILEAIWYGLNSLFGTIMIFIAFFVASDVTTTPNSTNTQLIYSMIIVLVTFYIREVSSNVEGVLYAILFANMFVPMLNAKSGLMSQFKIRKMISLASILFIISTLFIGYNSNMENQPYSEYDHYSINRNRLSCQIVDGEASASVEGEEPQVNECDLDQSVDGVAQASMSPEVTDE